MSGENPTIEPYTLETRLADAARAQAYFAEYNEAHPQGGAFDVVESAVGAAGAPIMRLAERVSAGVDGAIARVTAIGRGMVGATAEQS